MATNDDDDDIFGLNGGENEIFSSQESLHFIRNDESNEDGEDHKVFNDPIHGHIHLHPLLVKIIDTPQFQRLRNVKQLGSTYFVYPGASHNRFEHCIGTSHLARRLVQILQKKQKNLNITDKDALCVEIAGLCHDLGHGPFSHMFDDQFLRKVRPNCDWTHEKGSCMMLDYLIEENELWVALKKYGIDENDIIFVKEMIAGPLDSKLGEHENSFTWPYIGRGEDKSFLYEIVSNERNKVDVDKWDYFARDCYYLGIHNSFDHNRFMHFVKVLQVDGERLQICARDKECFNLYEMFHTRSVLHRRAYQHKVSNAIDHMICDALVHAEPYIKITGKNGMECKISECVDDPVAFTKLNDGIFDIIAHSSKPELKPARDILNRILRRQLYQCIGVTGPLNSLSLCNIPEQIASFDASGQLDRLDLVINKRKLNYGMHDKNPIDSFRFFSKAYPRKPYHMRKEDVSPMLPDVFEELKVQVFCTNRAKVSIAIRCFQDWCKRMKLRAKSATLDVAALTPMKRTATSYDINPCAKRKINLL